MDNLVKNLVKLKQAFAKNYQGRAHIQEVIPLHNSDAFDIDEKQLEQLHDFALKNPIYFNRYPKEIDSTPCIVYEGDINEYWLNSIKHGSSCQPFYPTWVMSAYVLACTAKEAGCTELVDIGSGDGRIAYCGSVVGVAPYSIEIDDVLVSMQGDIGRSTEKNFNPVCCDALEFDYTVLNLKRPAFFIGGLAQMGGDVLAAGIIDRVKSIDGLSDDTMIVFAGTDAKRQLSGNHGNGGWSETIKRYGLDVVSTVSLPAIWTFDQDVETPYVFTRFQ